MPVAYETDASGILQELRLHDIEEVHLYCNDDPEPVWSMGIPTEQNFDFYVLLGYGTHICQATVVASGRESKRSESTTRVVVPTTNPMSPIVE